MKRGSAPQGEKDHGDKALWDLLGRARKTQASPYFARKVVRAVEEIEAGMAPHASISFLASFWSWFRRPVVLSCCLVAVLAMAASLFLQSPQPSEGSFTFTDSSHNAEKSIPEGVDFTEELQSIGRFGELMAVTDPAELSDEALLALLF